MNVSVVVPTFNKDVYLPLTLQSLFMQDLERSSYEVILIDDGSTDSTAAVAKSFAERDWNFEYLKRPHRGRSASRNIGVNAASGDCIVFIDDDCICSRNLLTAHLARHRSKSQQTAVVSSRRHVFTKLPDVYDSIANVLNLRMFELNSMAAEWTREKVIEVTVPTTFDVVSVDDVANRLDKIDRLSMQLPADRERHLERIARSDFSCPWGCFITSNCSAAKDALISAGMFDEYFQDWGEEDHELGYRLFQNGVSFDAVTEATVYHQVHPRDTRMEWRSWLRNYIYFAEKHDTAEIYLRWKWKTKVISMDEYEALVRQLQSGVLSREKQLAIKRDYEQFVSMKKAFGNSHVRLKGVKR